MLVGAALHAQAIFALQDLIGGQGRILARDNHFGNGEVGVGESYGGGPFRRNAHARAHHVDLLAQQGGNDAVPVHGLMLDLEAHLLGDPVHRVHVEARGLAVLAHIGKGRIVGVDAVDIGFGRGRNGGAQGKSQSGETQRHFMMALPHGFDGMVFMLNRISSYRKN